MASASRVLLSRLRSLPTAAASSYHAVRPLAAAGSLLPSRPWLVAPVAATTRRFSTQHYRSRSSINSSLSDETDDDASDGGMDSDLVIASYSRRSVGVKEEILLNGCDFEHWLVLMQPSPGDPHNPSTPRDEIIDSYIKTLAMVVGRYVICLNLSAHVY